MTTTMNNFSDEPNIMINGHTLSFSQSATIRVALQSFAMDLNHNSLGEDHIGKSLTKSYLQRITEINKIISNR